MKPYVLYPAISSLVIAGLGFSAKAQAPDDFSSHAPKLPFQVQLLNEFRPIGGTGNNLVHPDFDVVPNTPELSLTPLRFAPGTDDGLAPGPNPRTISNVVSGGTGAQGQNGYTNDPVASAWLYVFGQFVDHDIDLEETPPDSDAINIIVPAGDPVFQAGTSIEMTRDTRSPLTNTIINTVAGDLDLSQLYGVTQDMADSLRNPDGTLMSSGDGQYLPVEDDQFITGDPRVMENPELTALTMLFMREHNYWVRVLKAQHPNWSGDQLYNMAKAITTAEYQNIVYKEYLPMLLGNVLGPYRGYNPEVNAQVTQEFSTAAFRMGHSQVSDMQDGVDNHGNVVFTETLAQAFFNTPAIDEANGINALLHGLGSDYSQATDVYCVAALRNLLFAGLVGGDVDEIDLIAIDIQREADVGLGTLNQTRRALEFNEYNSFAQLTSDPALQANLQSVYGCIDNVDLFIGGLAEAHLPGALLGPTFEAIIAKQFDALRCGDRFFWLNQGFDSDTAAMIRKTTLSILLQRDANCAGLQPSMFTEYTLPSHPQPTTTAAAVAPKVTDTHGRTKPYFIDDGK